MTPALDIQDLRFAFAPGDRPVVDVARFTLAPAEPALLTGSSGSGKSTLLQLIAGLLDPSAGSVRVNGQRIHDLAGARRDLFRGGAIGIIFQTFNLLPGFSAAENVMLAMMFSRLPRRAHAPRAAALLDRLGIPRHGADPDRLSVGQQQRVAIARALACKPALVLADEPTASLDPENASGAIDLIQQVCAENGAALLCVSHDPAVARRFTRIHALDDLRGAPAPAPAPGAGPAGKGADA